MLPAYPADECWLVRLATREDKRVVGTVEVDDEGILTITEHDAGGCEKTHVSFPVVNVLYWQPITCP